MASKPTVVLTLPDSIASIMFKTEQLKRLSDAAEVIGPIMPNGGPAFSSGLGRARAAITGWGSPPFDQSLLLAAPRLELIAHSAGSIRNLVPQAVYDRRIRVTTAASANAKPVAQLTVALMVTLLKQVPWLAPAYARGDSEEAARRRAQCRELQDMEIGLIAASRVGREVIALLRSYPRLTIKVHDPYLPPEKAAELGVTLCSLEEACRCEVVSIHAPNIPQTHHLLNARTLGLLPDHAVLINTSRGALIDEAALVAELNRRPIYVALDVTDPEPPRPDSPLRAAPNLVLLPHIAGATRQACFDMGQVAIEETLRFLHGQPLHYEVTREMLPTQA